MNTGRSVFSQLMDFLPMNEFRKCVRLYKGDYKVRKFSCLDQFLSMAFAQLTYRESLRDIEVCLRTTQPRLYHMGFRSRISRSTPEPIASTSMVALSVSTSTTTSPDSTGSPFRFTHLSTCPSSIVGESFDIMIRLAMC